MTMVVTALVGNKMCQWCVGGWSTLVPHHVYVLSVSSGFSGTY